VRHSQPLKDPNREKRIYAFRTIIALLVVALMLSALIARMYDLQVKNHEHFQTLSDKNRMQLNSVAPTRGLIYDRNGTLLADNRPIFSLVVVPEQVKDLEEMYLLVGSIISLSEAEISNFEKRLKRSRRPYQPVVLKSNLDES
jgi:penicillin-binding protein 2